ncbi:cation diffusion facilitator family transporter [Atopobium minutum]|nr:cation diffusion facilitator family transporter [Atopobium minutum]MDU5357235.1 cation diffusion facilitator family transporter [Atopobium minutum]
MEQWIMSHLAPEANDLSNPQDRRAWGAAAALAGIGFNLLLFVFKALVGLLGGSVSIFADAVNNLSDAGGNIIAWFGFKLAAKPADTEHPYGHGRYEYLSGLIVAVIVMVIGVELLKTSFEKIVSPAPVSFGTPAALVLVASILVKFYMFSFNESIGKQIDSSALMAASVDARNDVITTSAVLMANFLPTLIGFNFDGWAGLAVAIYIIYSGFGLIKDTIDPLLGSAPDPKLVKHIQNTIMSYEGILGTHDLMVHNYGPGRIFISAHVEMAAEIDPLKSHDVIDNIERHFQEEGIVCILHYDPIVTNDPHLDDMRNWIARRVRAIDPRLTIHDVRCIPGPTHTTIIFDCVRPTNLPMTDDELKQAITRTVSKRYPQAVCNITIDQNFLRIEA